MPSDLKRISGRRGSLDAKVRVMPNLAGYIQQYGLKDGVTKFDTEMEKWRQELQRILPTEETVTTIVQTIIQGANTIIQQTSTGSPSVDVTAILAQIQALSDALAAHIASVIVHGTTSPVVGETDEQILEKKTIGFSDPRNAKFKHVLQVSNIESTETFIIPAGYNMIVAGPFVIDGILVVDGSFACVSGP